MRHASDGETDAPGANDNASGMAGVIEAARVLGRRPLTIFRTIALPLARPAIIAGLYPTWRICRISPTSYLKSQ